MSDEVKSWKVGDYAMLRGTTVRISQQFESGRFEAEFVSDYRHGVGVTCGGASFSYGHEDFSPVTDVEALILCRAYEAQRLIKAAKVQIAEQEKVFAAHVAALRAVQDARAALSAESQHV